MKLCTFHVDELLLGIEVTRVQEVLHGEAITPVPLAPAGVAGLINLRGQIATAVDTRHRLGLAHRPAGGTAANVVIRSNGETMTLVVDRDGDVVDVDDALFETVPETVSPVIRAMTMGTYKIDGRLLLLLDPDRALAVQDD